MKRRAALLLLILTLLCSIPLGSASMRNTRGRGAANRLRFAPLRGLPPSLAAVALAICLLCGCAKPALQKESAQVIIYPAQCPKPARPDLPKISGVFLESGKGYSILKRRDRLMRDYISGLEDTISCYEAQLPPYKESKEAENGTLF